MQLSKSERFLKDYTDFKNRISKVSEESIKKELQGLLSQLYSEVQSIDQQHQNLFFGAENRLSLNEGHNNIVNLRKKISQKLAAVEKLQS